MNFKTQQLWTALVTPLTQDYKIDWDSLKNLINEQIDAKNGLLILGSTGEALNLDTKTKMQIVKFAIEHKKNAPLMIGIGGHLLSETQDWLAYLESSQEIDAYLMVTPIYAKPGAEGQYQWFKSLMDKCTRPAMLYNVPGRAGTSLSIDAVKRLLDHPNFWAIKEASGSVEKFKEYFNACNGKNVFCGDDALMPDFALNGSCGLVSVASNVWPKETNEYVKQCLTKKFDAKELWEAASNSMFIASNPVPAKAALHHLKRITTAIMMPPLHHNDLKDIAPIMAEDKKVKAWYADQQ